MRQDRKWSQTQAFKELREGLGYGPSSRASYIGLDMGTRVPTPEQQAFLVKYFGKSPDDLPATEISEAPATEGMAGLIDALSRQTTAMEELVKRLDGLASKAIRAGVQEALQLAGLFPAAAASRSEQPPGQQP